MVGILSQLPYVGEKIATSSAGAGASTFMIAYFVHKMMAPIRYVHCNQISKVMHPSSSVPMLHI